MLLAYRLPRASARGARARYSSAAAQAGGHGPAGALLPGATNRLRPHAHHRRLLRARPDVRHHVVLAVSSARASGALPSLQRLRPYWRMLKRASTLATLAVPVALAAPLLYCGPRSEDRWWRMCLRAVEGAGPTYIKLAQWAASRADMFPVAMTKQFSKLHSDVAAHALSQSVETLDKSFGPGWRDRLVLDTGAAAGGILGSGCIAQVHRATLGDETVAVKIIHPLVRETVAQDMELLSFVSRNLERLVPRLRYLALGDTTDEFSRLLLAQLDMRTEADNLDRMAEIFGLDSNGNGTESTWWPGPARPKGILFPRPQRQFVSEDVLVETFIDGSPINDPINVARHGEEVLQAIIGVGSKAVLEMLLVHNFVHGDMHPGNILVTKDGRVAFIDCGICIKLSPKLHDHMIAILGAWMDYDGYGAGELMVDRSNDQSTLGKAVGVDAFCTGMGRLVERAMTEEFFRHFGEYIGEIFGLACEHHVRLESTLVTCALSMRIIEGVVLQVRPGYDICTTALPMIAEQKARRMLLGAGGGTK